MKKYIVRWQMPYQGAGVETARVENYEKAGDAYRQLVSVQCEPGCFNAHATASGRTVSVRQLRAWAKL